MLKMFNVIWLLIYNLYYVTNINIKQSNYDLATRENREEDYKCQ